MLVRAAGILAREGASVRCVIVGDGPERARLESLVARERAPVELRPWMRHDELMALLSRAAAVVVPSVEDRSGDRDGIPFAQDEGGLLRGPVHQHAAEADPLLDARAAELGQAGVHRLVETPAGILRGSAKGPWFRTSPPPSR